MRREIARAMHDGPAQSLTNIVLQAQIVEYLVSNDPTKASGEVRQLVAMVQQTLDATKSFIFDVRPMMLDDLGLVPTLRRAARDHGRRAGIPVEFESMGQDQRLPMDLESGLFRIVDEALVTYLGAGAERVAEAGLVGSGGGHDFRLARDRQGGLGARTRGCPRRRSSACPRRDDAGAPGRRAEPGGIRAARGDREPSGGDLARDPGQGRDPGVRRPALCRRLRAPARDGPATGRVRSQVIRLAPMRGQGIVEYGLILALTAVITALVLGLLGGTLAEVLSAIGGAIDAATGEPDRGARPGRMRTIYLWSAGRRLPIVEEALNRG